MAGMTERILGLVVANVLLAVFGAGLLPFLRLARTRRELLTRLPLGYAVGVAAGGIVVAHLSLVHVAVGRIGLPLLAAASLALGLWRTRLLQPRPRTPARLGDLLGL